jgi:hypothetical protein
MHFKGQRGEHIQLPDALLEDLKNASVPFKRAVQMARGTVNRHQKNVRIQRHEKYLEQFQKSDAPTGMIEAQKKLLTKIRSEQAGERLKEVVLYKTVEEIIRTIRYHVKKGASIMRILEWCARDSALITPSLSLQESDERKDRVLEEVASFLARAVTDRREDLVYAHMDDEQIAQFSAARDLEMYAELSPFLPRPDLQGESPEIALRKLTEENLEEAGQLGFLVSVATAIYEKLTSVLREELRFPLPEARGNLPS